MNNSSTPFNDMIRDLKNEQFQWVIAVSVGTLVAIYANAFANLCMVKSYFANPVYQYFNIIMLTVVLMSILLMYGRYITIIYPKLIYLDEYHGHYKVSYTARKDALSDFYKTLLGWRLLVRMILYVAYVSFWFGVKYSFDYLSIISFDDFKMISAALFGLNVYHWSFIVVIIFSLLLEAPVVYSYLRFKKIITSDSSH